jgi:ankyrin repeat protein
MSATTPEPTQEELRPFVLAAHGNFAAVKELLAAQPVLLNARFQDFNETALEAAAHTGQREIAQYLLDAGAPLTICAAAMLGRTEDVAAFLASDPTLANSAGAHGIPLLFHVALSGKTEIADLLVAHGGGDGASPALNAAAPRGHRAMVAWLLAHGADPNTPNFQGKLPMRLALDNGQTEIADLIREHGGREE